MRITVDATGVGTPISPNLFGIFFEDINYAADGGLYAELIQNRSFEQDGGSLAEWEVTGGQVSLGTADPLHPNNTHYAVLDGGGLRNSGYDGIVLKAGELYDLSLFARGEGESVVVRLESASGVVHGEVTIGPFTTDWSRYTATIEAPETDRAASLTVSASGVVHLDVVSLFPRRTFKGRSNGLREDLAQVIADLRPKFMRFPGGCLVHGNGLGNMYRWKDTIGPIEQRREQSNIWGYHQSVGLGYFEYFQFCEDIGAKPMPVVPAGVCCQNSAEGGQRGIPMDEMPEYVREVLDLIEYANGPATSTWGAKRAEAGHPEPFHLEYLAVGNEDQQTPEFRERFEMIYRAVRERYPEIIVIGTVGVESFGADFDAGWRFAEELGLSIVDEHYYKSPQWFLENTRRYDSHDRSGPQVYVGEYASNGTTLDNALAEAAYMVGLERNGDVVAMASYAPLLAKHGRTQWATDLVYFDNTHVYPTPNYYVQQLHSIHSGDALLPSTVDGGPKPAPPQRSPRQGVFLGGHDTDAEFADVSCATGVDRYTITLKGRKTGGRHGIVVGFGDDLQWQLGAWGNRAFALQRGGDNIVDPVPGTIETGRWYDIRIDMDGGRIRCFLDGEPIHDVDDPHRAQERFAVSSTRDSHTGDIIVKVVNATPAGITARIDLEGVEGPMPATKFVMGEQPEPLEVGPSFDCDFPPRSFTVIRAAAGG